MLKGKCPTSLPQNHYPRPGKFEVQTVMRLWNNLDASAGTGGADAGIDIRANSALAQANWKSDVTGRPDGQRLVGGARRTGTERLFFFNVSGSNKVEVALFTYAPVGPAEAVTSAVRRVLESAGQQVPPPPTDWKLVAVLTARFSL